MIRKIVKQGNGAYTLTLPIEWIKKNNLKQKDEVSIIFSENKLLISQETYQEPMILKITLEEDNFNLFLVTLIEAYTLGYDRIIINAKSKNAEAYIDKITTEYFLGFELSHREGSSFIIENISEPDNRKFEGIFRKMFILCLESFKGIMNSIENKNKANIDVKGKLDQFEKYNNFCMRCIIKRILNYEVIPQYWLTLSLLTKFKRSFAYLTNRLNSKKDWGKAWQTIIQELYNNLNSLSESFFKSDIKGINRVYELNRNLLKKINNLLPKSEIEAKLYYHIIEFQRLISYLTAPMIAIIHSQNKELL